ncbi:MAG: hypothetical protein HY842_13355, partial [Bacteroidetes bacterium]|nr:hypothetical protein [Bacteroidota bacterium]
MPWPSCMHLWLTSILWGWLVFLPAQTTNGDIRRHFPQPTLFTYSGFEYIIRIAEDNRGFAWLATNRGLFCFDGSLFRKITHSDDGKFSAVDAGQINDLFFDQKKEQLWLATEAGASRLDLNTETFTDFIFY